LTATDLFAIAHWLPEQELPTFKAYLHGKYQDMPEDVIKKLEDCLREAWAEYDCPKAPAGGARQ
jgi:hypothetical protein